MEQDKSDGRGDAAAPAGRNPERVLTAATGQATLTEAVLWIAEGLHLHPGTRSELLVALTRTPADTPGRSGAMQRLAREAAQSNLDTAAVLIETGEITPPSHYRRALDLVAIRNSTRSLAGLTHRAVLDAQRDDPFVIPTLAAVAGLSYTELRERAGATLPSQPGGHWTAEAMEAAFNVIDGIVSGLETTTLKKGLAARPIELLGDPDLRIEQTTGWAAVERMRCTGVSYETLLAQRTEGGAWRTHRDRTGGKFSHIMAQELCDELEGRGVDFLRAKNFGGTAKASRLGDLLAGGRDERQVAVVTLSDAGEPRFAVAFATAKDGGSARSAINRLVALPKRISVPAAVVVSGPGFAERNETAQLAEAYGGRLFTDESLSQLVDMICTAVGTDGGTERGSS